MIAMTIGIYVFATIAIYAWLTEIIARDVARGRHTLYAPAFLMLAWLWPIAFPVAPFLMLYLMLYEREHAREKLRIIYETTNTEKEEISG